MAGIDIKQMQAPLAAKKKKETGLLDWMSKDIQLFGKKFSDKKKERFYSELQVLLSSGIDLKSALEIIVDQQEKKEDKALFEEVLKTVVDGKGLADALQETKKFSLYEYYSLLIGEESGRVNDVLKEITRYYQGRIKQKRQVISALTYPAVVTFTAIAAVTIMLKFIVPMFADIFKRFNTELPFLTRMIIKLSETLSDYFLIVLVLIIGIAVFISYQRKKEWFRKLTSFLLMKTPVFGKIIKKVYLARFCQSMSLLLGARTPLINALDLVKKMIRFYPMETSLNKVREDIMTGTALHESLSAFPFYEKRMVSLIKVGEEVNRLDEIFERLSQQYEEEVEAQTAVLSTLMEPVLIIFLGIVVGVILIAMYLPIFQLTTTVGM